MGNPTVTEITLTLKDQGEGVFGTGESSGLFRSVPGVSFGTGPTVILFDRFLGQSDGETINQAADVGTWRSNGNFSFNNRPPVITFDGRKGVSHNDPAAGQGSTRFGLAIENLDFTEYTEFYKVGVPAGKTFAGATAVETFPSVSSMKFTWPSGYGWNGSDGEIDWVSISHTGSGSFRAGGNNIVGHFWNGFSGAWEWEAWNSILNVYQPDSPDLQGPNGVNNLNMWNGNGRLTDINDPIALFEDNGGLPLPTPLQFDRLPIMAWSGNGTHTNSQMNWSQYYMAVGTDHQKIILLANNADLDLATNTDAIVGTWTDGVGVEFTMSAEEAADNSHYFIMDGDTELATGAL